MAKMFLWNTLNGRSIHIFFISKSEVIHFSEI